MNTVDEYLSKTGQSLQYLMSGVMQFGADYIEQLAGKALLSGKRINWKTVEIDGEDLGLLEYEFVDIPPKEHEYKEAIVANIIGNHLWGEDKQIKSGTKHFRAGTKVYCVFMYAGMGHENVRVMGKPRKSFKMIDVVIRRTYLKNFRVQKVYAPILAQVCSLASVRQRTCASPFWRKYAAWPPCGSVLVPHHPGASMQLGLCSAAYLCLIRS